MIIAISNVNESIYSISDPNGIPWAIVETVTSSFSNNLEIYLDVVSPSILGLTAIITSFIFSFFILFNKSSILISSGVTPSTGEIKPFNTWYNPLNTPTFSNKITFLGSSTTHRTFLSLESSEHISHN